MYDREIIYRLDNFSPRNSFSLTYIGGQPGVLSKFGSGGSLGVEDEEEESTEYSSR